MGDAELLDRFAIQWPRQPLLAEHTTKFAVSAASAQPLGSLFEQMLLVVFDALVLQLTTAGDASNADMAHRHASLE